MKGGNIKKFSLMSMIKDRSPIFSSNRFSSNNSNPNVVSPQAKVRTIAKKTKTPKKPTWF